MSGRVWFPGASARRAAGARLRVIFTAEPHDEATPPPVPVSGYFGPLDLALLLVELRFDPHLLQGNVFVREGRTHAIKATVVHRADEYWAQAAAEWMEYIT